MGERVFGTPRLSRILRPSSTARHVFFAEARQDSKDGIHVSSAPCATACFGGQESMASTCLTQTGSFPEQHRLKAGPWMVRDMLQLVPKRVDPEYWVNSILDIN